MDEMGGEELGGDITGMQEQRDKVGMKNLALFEGTGM
jgi:hypothetical protein